MRSQTSPHNNISPADTPPHPTRASPAPPIDLGARGVAVAVAAAVVAAARLRQPAWRHRRQHNDGSGGEYVRGERVREVGGESG